MKAILTFCILLLWQALANAQDLPNPPANIQTMPQDSYVIAMDNTWQATTGSGSVHYFNLKAYGLVVYLLNNNVKVRRVIRAGKKKDEADFSASCRQVKPKVESSAQTRNFKAGPFVIFGPDLLRINIDQLIDNYNKNVGGVSGIKHDTAKIRVYKTIADVKVDVRYDLTGFKPKAAVLTDGSKVTTTSYTQVHLTYFTMAGIPATNYSLAASSELSNACYTFASEPHNDYKNATVVADIKKFVLAGGNFLAQCAAISTYDSLGHFQSTVGASVSNSTPSSVQYPNADLGMAQFEGSFDMKAGGSCQNWKCASSFANGAHAFVANASKPTTSSLIGASASKLIAASSPGGMTFFLGNHSYTLANDYKQINGMRMYLNAFLTPANIQKVLRYTYVADCNAGNIKVASLSGPTQAYPVTFYLYQDNGSSKGEVDAGDAFLGAATVSSAGAQKLISLSGSDPKGDFIMKVVPSSSCYKTEQVSPAPCRFITLASSLINFTATRNGNTALLRWQTVQEVGNNGFYVQQWINNEWRDIGFVPSAAVGGNSNGLLQYQFVTEVKKGATQYRIKMEGLGGVQYSDVRLLKGDEVPTLFSIYPNPSSGHVVLAFSNAEKRSVAVYDVAGRSVYSREDIRSASQEMHLAAGIFMVKVSDAAGHVQTQKLIVR